MTTSPEILVPPCELCDEIECGEFENTALVWCMDKHGELSILPRSDGEFIFLYNGAKGIVPAPSLVEIIHELPKEHNGGLLTIYNHQIGYACGGGWVEPPVSLEPREYLESLTDAAMRLFLRIKGRLPNGEK